MRYNIDICQFTRISADGLFSLHIPLFIYILRF